MSVFTNVITDPPCGTQLSRGGRFGVAGLLALIFTIYFLFSLLVPYVGDDYSLQVDWMTANGGERFFSWDGLWRFAAYMRETDNARLDNVIFCGMCLAFPKWVLAAVIGGSCGVMLLSAARMVSPSERTLPYVMMAFWAWMTFTFSWRGGVMGVDNSFNVMLPSAVTLVFLLLAGCVARGKLPAGAALAECVYALFAGAIHEGYSVPVCCGFGVWCLMRRFRLPWQWWAMAVCYFAGAVYVVSAPGIWARLGYDGDPTPGVVNVKTLVSMTMSVVVGAAVAVVAGVVALRRSGLTAVGRWFCERPLRAVVGVSFVVSVAVALKTGMGNSRALWICNLFAAVLMFEIIASVFVVLSRRTLDVLAGVAFVIVVAFYVNVIRVQKAIFDEESEIMTQMAESESGTVYRDYDISLPKTTLLHPVKAHWRNGLHIAAYDGYMADGKLYAVVPECLAGLTDEMADYINGEDVGHRLSTEPEVWPQPVEGSAGCFVYGDALVMRDERMELTTWLGKTVNTDTKTVTLDYVCVDGRRFDGMLTVLLRFVTPSGRRLRLVAPAHVKVTGPYEKISAAE